MQRARSLTMLTFALAALNAGSGAAVAAQEVVPKELALALMRGTSDGGDILVGIMPPDLAPVLPLPPGGRVLGSFVSLSYVQVVLAVPGNADSARAYARRALVEHGWIPPEPLMAQMGGLQYPPTGGGLPTTFCKASAGPPAALNVSASFYGPTTSLLRITRTGSALCEQGGARAERVEFVQLGSGGSGAYRSPFATLPPLYSPGDPRSSMQTCRMATRSGGQASQSQELRTPMTPFEILAHYARQLDSAGWKRVAAQDSGAATGSWSKADTVRQAQEVTITVAPIANQAHCYHISLSTTYFLDRR